MEVSVNLMRQMEEVEPSIRKVLYSILEEIERQSKERVTKDDFNELKSVVGDLAKAQERTEARLDALVQRVDALAQAQERTEARLESLAQAQEKTEARLEALVQRVDALAQAQERTEARLESLAQAQERTEARLEALVQRVDALAQAQERTEARLESLAQAQERTEARLESLAQAQERTEQALYKLAESHYKLKDQVSGLSDSVGYGLEDKLFPYIPAYAKRIYGMEVTSLERKNIEYSSGKYDEVNIFAQGEDEQGQVFLVGECKAKPGKKDVINFAKMIDRLNNYLSSRIYPMIIGYTFAPEVEKFILEEYPNIEMIKSYQIERVAREDIQHEI